MGHIPQIHSGYILSVHMIRLPFFDRNNHFQHLRKLNRNLNFLVWDCFLALDFQKPEH